MSALRAALVQTRTPAQGEAAVAHVLPLVETACAQGAEFILTPEAVNVMERRPARRAGAITTQDADPVVSGLCDLARRRQVWLLIGSAIVRADEEGDPRDANRSLLIDPAGRVAAAYDKVHLFDIDLPDGERHRESAVIRPGNRAVLAPTPWGPLGLSVCYDLRFAPLYHALARAGARLISVPAAFTRPTGEAHWEVLLRARAIETGAFILAPAQGGTHDDGRNTWGRSMVVDPWGRVIAALDHDAPGVLVVDLDLSAVDRARAAIPQLSHHRAFQGPEGDVA